MKGPLTVDNPITSKVDRGIWAIPNCKNNIGVEIRILGCVFSRINFYTCLTKDE